jgi:hypothetical protein
MKARQLLFVAIAAAMLVSMIAVPVMADDEITMWVSRVRLAYNGRSSHSSDRVVGMIHVRDANLAAVVGAEVTAEWTLPDGTVSEETAVTAFQGIATFTIWEGRGVYQLCVTDVTKDGWDYAEDQNRETCAKLTVRIPFHPDPQEPRHEVDLASPCREPKRWAPGLDLTVPGPAPRHSAPSSAPARGRRR